MLEDAELSGHEDDSLNFKIPLSPGGYHFLRDRLLRGMRGGAVDL